jgi:hypothetical protein
MNDSSGVDDRTSHAISAPEIQRCGLLFPPAFHRDRRGAPERSRNLMNRITKDGN